MHLAILKKMYITGTKFPPIIISLFNNEKLSITFKFGKIIKNCEYTIIFNSKSTSIHLQVFIFHNMDTSFLPSPERVIPPTHMYYKLTII